MGKPRRKKPPAPSVRTRLTGPRAIAPSVIERTRRQAIADYRARHANGEVDVTTSQFVPIEQVDALAAVRAQEIIGRHLVVMACRRLDRMVKRKFDDDPITFRTTVATLRSMRDALQKAGYANG